MFDFDFDFDTMIGKIVLIVQEILADFHGKTANLDERMSIIMVVAMKIPVDFRYGPHLRYLPLPWKHNEQLLRRGPYP